MLTQLSSFNPIQLGNCIQWYNGSIGITVISGKVSSWIDQSIYNNSATQTNSDLRPGYVTYSLNGRPGLNFSGNKYLILTSQNTFSGLSGITFFVVARFSSTDTSQCIYYASQHGNTWLTRFEVGLHLNNNGIDVISSVATGGSYYSNSADNQISATNHIISIVNNYLTNTSYSYLDGTLSSSKNNYGNGTAMETSDSSCIWIGFDQNYYFSSYIYEIIIYSNNLSTSNRKVVEKYLSRKYAITTAS